MDYKGLTASHVIFGFAPETYPQAAQGLGRGSRDLATAAEGTIITHKPLTLNAADYLDLLQTNDEETAEALKINSKVARAIHGLSVSISVLANEVDSNATQKEESSMEHNVLKTFLGLMRKGKNIINEDPDRVLWRSIRELDKSGTIPDTPYSEWPK